jgi:hypothetical protein
VRFRRATDEPDGDDIVIDVRERLAPYFDPQPSPEDPVAEPALIAGPSRFRPVRATRYEPRHLAR